MVHGRAEHRCCFWTAREQADQQGSCCGWGACPGQAEAERFCGVEKYGASVAMAKRHPDRGGGRMGWLAVAVDLRCEAFGGVVINGERLDRWACGSRPAHVPPLGSSAESDPANGNQRCCDAARDDQPISEVDRLGR